MNANPLFAASDGKPQNPFNLPHLGGDDGAVSARFDTKIGYIHLKQYAVSVGKSV
jgi:hypothetical protein